jgi:hypothetical protein
MPEAGMPKEAGQWRPKTPYHSTANGRRRASLKRSRATRRTQWFLRNVYCAFWQLVVRIEGKRYQATALQEGRLSCHRFPWAMISDLAIEVAKKMLPRLGFVLESPRLWISSPVGPFQQVQTPKNYWWGRGRHPIDGGAAGLGGDSKIPVESFKSRAYNHPRFRL